MKSFFSVLALVAQAALVFSSPQVAAKAVGNQLHYRTCNNPGTNISVINFEYTEGQKLFDHRGLSWRGFTGYKRYYGHADGWSPNPSNYTTAHISWSGQSAVKAQVGTGPRAALSRVHSFWFYLGFTGYTTPGVLVPVTITATGPGVSYSTTIYTEPSDDGLWEHVCLDWNPVEFLTFVVPACYDRTIGSNCKTAIFEVDDIWVGGYSLRPYRFPTPKLEAD